MKEAFKYVWPLLGNLRIFIVASLLLLIAGDIFGIFIPYQFGLLVNDLQEGNGNAVTIAVLAVAAMFSSHMFGWLREYIDLKKYFFSFSEKLEGHASQRLMGLSIGQHISMNSGVINETVSVGISGLKDFIISILFSLIPHIMYVVLSLAAVVLISWKMGVAVTVLSLAYIVASIRFNKRYEKRLLDLETEHRKRGKYKSEMLRNVISVKICGQEDWFLKRYNSEINRVNNIARSVWLKYIFGSNLIRMFHIVITSTVLLLGLYLIRSGQETVGTFVTLFSWSGGVTARLSSIRSELRQLARTLPGIKKYLDLVNQESDLSENGTKTDIPYGRITFSKVSYTYTTDKDDSNRGVRNVSFEISPGEMIGIVGESGAGKSTLLKLLVRAWDPQSGGIYIDNTPLKEFAPTFRQQISFVQQDGQLFDNMIRFNLTMGLEDQASDDLLWEALSLTQLADRVRQSEQGLDTPVGERGIKLSGGERQRLLMARAIVRKTKILILDEATSNLDVNTEEELFQNAIKRAARDVTTLIIAHRFATLKSCDRIMVMEKGELIAFDTHENLMRTCALYKELVAKQTLVTSLS